LGRAIRFSSTVVSWRDLQYPLLPMKLRTSSSLLPNVTVLLLTSIPPCLGNVCFGVSSAELLSLTEDKMDIVKRILSTLTQKLKDADAAGSNHIEYERLDASAYYETKVSCLWNNFDNSSKLLAACSLLAVPVKLTRTHSTTTCYETCNCCSPVASSFRCLQRSVQHYQNSLRRFTM
jgi:hypothetical protein